jgi:hypothetical protein
MDYRQWINSLPARSAGNMIYRARKYKDPSIWYAQNRDFGGSVTKKKKSSFFCKSILGTTTFFFALRAFLGTTAFFFLALRAILGTTTVFFSLALRAILRYNNRFSLSRFETERIRAGRRVARLNMLLIK